jgi:hypothetical protein
MVKVLDGPLMGGKGLGVAASGLYILLRKAEKQAVEDGGGLFHGLNTPRGKVMGDRTTYRFDCRGRRVLGPVLKMHSLLESKHLQCV